MSREVPILFSAPMVRANRGGLKDVTRRLINPQPKCGGGSDWLAKYARWKKDDVLWVRETWGFTAKWPVSDARRHIQGGGPWMESHMAYRADEPQGNWCWRPSIHMPYWACRNLYTVVSVRAERLQDITGNDARREGIQMDARGWFFVDGLQIKGRTLKFNTAIEAYFALFASINGTDSIVDNPWLFRIEYLNPAR